MEARLKNPEAHTHTHKSGIFKNIQILNVGKINNSINQVKKAENRCYKVKHTLNLSSSYPTPRLPRRNETCLYKELYFNAYSSFI